MKRSWIVTSILLLVLVATLVAGCAKEEEVTPTAVPPEEVPVKIGIIGDLSGPTSALAGIAYGARDYLSYYDWKFGGINGHPIEYLLLDGAEDLPKEIANYKHLMTLLKPVAIHVWSTGANKALRQDISHVDKVPTAAETMSGEIIDPVNLPYHFISGPTYEDEIMVVMDWVKEMGGKSLVILSGDLDWNISPTKRVLEEFKYQDKIGLEVLEYITFPAKPTDVTSEMLRAKALNPDFYYVWDVLEGVIPVLRAGSELGIPSEKFLWCHWAFHPLAIERAGAAAEGGKSFKLFMDVDELLAKGLAVGLEVDDFSKTHKVYTRRWEYVKGWTETKIQVEAIKRALDKNNNLVPEDIMEFRKMVRDEWEGIKDYDPGIGIGTIDYSDHKGWTTMQPMIVRDGKWVEYGPTMELEKY